MAKEYPNKSFRVEASVLEAVKKDGRSVNQLLKVALGLDAVVVGPRREGETDDTPRVQRAISEAFPRPFKGPLLKPKERK